jgi:hypothetical protein
MAPNDQRPARPADARAATPARPAPAPAPPAAGSRPVQRQPNAAQQRASQDAAKQAQPAGARAQRGGAPAPENGNAQERRNAAGQRITRATPPTREVFATAPGANDAFNPEEIRKRQDQVRQERRRRAEEQPVISSEEAQRDADTVAPNVSVAAPNPRPRPGVSATARERIGVVDGPLPAAQSPDRLKVQATRLGYYELQRRRPGDVFFVSDAEAFSDRWMRKVHDDTPVRTTTQAQALRQEQDALRAMKRNEPFAPRTNQAVRDQFQAEQNQEAGEEDLPPEESVATGDQDLL